MSRESSTQRQALILLSIALFAFTTLLIVLRQGKDTNPKRGNVSSPLEPSDHRKRIDEFIGILQTESFEQSLGNLNEAVRFDWPGVISQDPNALERILSNRRVIRLWDALEKMDAAQSKTKSELVFTRMLDEHRATVQQILNHYEKGGLEPDRFVSTHTLTVGAGLFLSAKFGGAETVVKEIRQLDQFREWAEERLDGSKVLPPSVPYMVKTYGLKPDNQFFISLYASLITDDARYGKVELEEMKALTIELTVQKLEVDNWDAVDESRGMRTATQYWLGPLRFVDNERQVKLVQDLRAIVERLH